MVVCMLVTWGLLVPPSVTRLCLLQCCQSQRTHPPTHATHLAVISSAVHRPHRPRPRGRLDREPLPHRGALHHQLHDVAVLAAVEELQGTRREPGARVVGWRVWFGSLLFGVSGLVLVWYGASSGTRASAFRTSPLTHPQAHAATNRPGKPSHMHPPPHGPPIPHRHTCAAGRASPPRPAGTWAATAWAPRTARCRTPGPVSAPRGRGRR